VEQPEVEFEKSPGHFTEWVNAIKGKKMAVSNFQNYAGALTETILLGNLAVYSGEKVYWDAKTMTAKDRPDLEPLIRPTYRKGWEV